ncbi:MAG: hypothetical protein WC575_00660 [Patescibacteria group bacterium]
MLIPKSLPLKKVIILSIVLIVALGLAGYFIYENFLKDKVVSTLESGFRSKQQLFEQPVVLPEVQDFDANFFNNELIIELQNYGPLPVIVDDNTQGRDNPFAPLSTQGSTKK